jgi:hypothetical protein
VSLAVTDSQKTHVGNGAQTIFPTTFAFLDNSHLTVEVAPAGGAYVTKLLGVDYNVTGAGQPEPGGNVTFISGAPANLSTVRITRNTPRVQPVAFKNQQQFLSETHERAHDNREMQIQEIERRLALQEAGGVTVVLNSTKVQDTFVCPDPQVSRNVACAGTPTGVELIMVEDLTDPALVHYGLGRPDISGLVLNQFTVRYVPGLTPGHNYRLTYLVHTL